MKQIPNIMTSARLCAALILLWECEYARQLASQHFVLLVVLAGISDMLDGYVARRFNWCTEFGARLDSLSDFVLYGAVARFFWVFSRPSLMQCGVLLAIGSTIQVGHWLLALARMRQFPAYHTTFSRVSAYLMFGGILAFWLLKTPGILGALALVWCACSLEGIAITMLLKKPLCDVSSIRTAILRSREV